MFRTGKFLAGILILFQTVCASAQAGAGWKQKLHEYLLIQQQLTDFNGIVVVDMPGEIVTDTIGFSCFEHKAFVQPNTVFPLASITKQFTAVMICKAVQDGKMSFTDPLGKFIPEIRESWRSITPGHLLSHTSGIPHNEGIPDYWQVKSRLSLTDSAALHEILSMPLLFKPGTSTQYSSPGYFLLAVILERLYNTSFETLLKRQILAPLNMPSSGIISSRQIIPQFSKGYEKRSGNLHPAPYRDPSLMKGSGDAYSSAPDLLRWNRSWMDSSLWDRQTRELIFSVHNPASVNGHNDPYGYGWFLRQPAGHLPFAAYTGGGSPGCSAISVIYPDKRISIIILSNITGVPVNQLWSDIEKIIFDQPFELPRVQSEQKITASDLSLVTGKYISDGTVLTIFRNGEQLYAKLGSNPAFEIFKAGDARFFGKKVSVELFFLTGPQGNLRSVSVQGRGRSITFIPAL
ncbi:MAG: serine hydrolase domain-containing protein [Chitinophagaceae bacterium]